MHMLSRAMLQAARWSRRSMLGRTTRAWSLQAQTTASKTAIKLTHVSVAQRRLKASVLARWSRINADATHTIRRLTKHLHRTHVMQSHVVLDAWRMVMLEAKALMVCAEHGDQKRCMQLRGEKRTVLLAWHTLARRERCLRVLQARFKI